MKGWLVMKKALLGLVVTLCCCQLGAAQPPGHLPPEEEFFDGEMAGEFEHPLPPPPGGGRVLVRRTLMGPQNDEQVLNFVQQHLPERARQLVELKNREPEAYRRELRRLGMRTAPLRHSADPAALEEWKAEEQLQVLRETYRSADGSARAGLKNQMKPLLEQLFAVRQARERKRLERLKQEAARLENRLNQREKNQAEIVERRLEQLTEEEALRW